MKTSPLEYRTSPGIRITTSTVLKKIIEKLTDFNLQVNLLNKMEIEEHRISVCKHQIKIALLLSKEKVITKSRKSNPDKAENANQIIRLKLKGYI